MRRLGTMVLAVAVMMTLAVPSVLAVGGGKPVARERFDDRFVEDPDQFVLAVCGVEVRTEFHFWGHFSVNADMSTREHVNVAIVSTDAATGKVLLVERNAFNGFSEPVVEVVDEQAGTLTTTSKSTYRGVPYKWRIPGEGVILLDAGTVTVTFAVVTDLAAGEFISNEVTYSDLHGPHPSLFQSESEWTALFCGAMGA